MTDRSDRRGLAAGYRLEQYEIRDLQAVDRVGLRYAAFDHATAEAVNLREYLPAGVAVRREGADVAAELRAVFDLGLAGFVADALRLARIDHPNVVRARGHVHANDTAYLVTDTLPETTLAQRLDPDRTLSPDTLLPILHGLLDGLETVHRAGLLHGQLSPETIALDEGNPLLIDFGVAPPAAGTARRAFRPASKFHTDPPNGDFAALEQYADRGQEGPWTDLYALAAVMFRCVTGRAPMNALHRALQEEALSLRDTAAPGYDLPLLDGIQAALAIRVADRPPGVAAWRELLAGAGDDGPMTSPPRAARTAARGFHRPAAPVTPPPRQEPVVAGRRAARAREDTPTEGGAVRWGFPALVLVALISVLTWVDAGVLRGPAPVSDEPVPAAAIPAQQRASPADRPAAASRPAPPPETLRPAPTSFRDQDRPGVDPAADPPRPAPPAREDGPPDALPRTVDTGLTETQVSPPIRAVVPPPADQETTAESGEQAPGAVPEVESPTPTPAAATETEGTLPSRTVPETRPSTALPNVTPPEPAPAHTLTLELVPADARVSFAEDVPPYRPGMELPSGSYRIMVTRTGFLPELRTVRVSGATHTTIVLEPDSRGPR